MSIHAQGKKRDFLPEIPDLMIFLLCKKSCTLRTRMNFFTRGDFFMDFFTVSCANWNWLLRGRDREGGGEG